MGWAAFLAIFFHELIGSHCIKCTRGPHPPPPTNETGDDHNLIKLVIIYYKEQPHTHAWVTFYNNCFSGT
jgi:hypothetical protein